MYGWQIPDKFIGPLIPGTVMSVEFTGVEFTGTDPKLMVPPRIFVLCGPPNSSGRVVNRGFVVVGRCDLISEPEGSSVILHPLD